VQKRLLPAKVSGIYRYSVKNVQGLIAMNPDKPLMRRINHQIYPLKGIPPLSVPIVIWVTFSM
jgi:hypothetical protein